MELDTGISDTRLDGSNKLIIAGSGRVALYICKFAAAIGYRVTVIDHISQNLTRDRFPEAGELLIGNEVQLLGECAIDENTSIVIITHHHENDEKCLLAVVNSPARYIGIMSNRHAIRAYLNKLLHLGIPEDRINRVHTPIGLDIGGQLAVEIALAAVAEIQAVKYNRSGGFMTVKQSSREVEKKDNWF